MFGRIQESPADAHARHCSILSFPFFPEFGSESRRTGGGGGVVVLQQKQKQKKPKEDLPPVKMVEFK